MSADLAAFLLARIAEDEAAARLATAGPWEWSDDGLELCGMAASTPRWVLSASYDDSIVEATPEDKAHIARWDPARVLAECEARRRIVERLSRYLSAEHDPEPEGAWELLDDHAWATLYDLAAPFADHPDFDPSWRP